jgi:hypothetical protein
MHPNRFTTPRFNPSLCAALIAGGIALCFASASGAQIYRWTDEKGRVTYSGTPPPGNAKAEPIQLRGVETYTAGPSQAPAASGATAGATSGAAPARAAGAAETGAAPGAEAAGAAADANCADGRSNCSRGEAPELNFPERTNERVRPQFTIGVPTPAPKPK